MDEKTPRIAITTGDMGSPVRERAKVCCICGDSQGLSEQRLNGSAMMRQGAAFTLLPGGIETLILLSLWLCKPCWVRIKTGRALILQG